MTDGSPSMAISVRIEHVAQAVAAFQRRHDLRLGVLPGYIDRERVALNSVLVPPLSATLLRQVCEERRAARETRRAMRSDAAVASRLIISFGHGAQAVFAALPVAAQDAAYQAVADRLARELGSTVAGLVVHRDESAPHAHVTMPAVAFDGRPLSKVVTRVVAARMQDWAVEEVASFAPSIVRGVPKVTREERGEPRSRTVHRSVRELHADLPQELAQGRRRRDDLVASVAVLAERVAVLQVKADRTEAEERRLAIYLRRHQVQAQEVAAALAEREATVERREAQAEAREEGFRLAVELVRDGAIAPDPETGRLRVPEGARDALRPVWPAIGRAVAEFAHLRAQWGRGLRRVVALLRRHELGPELRQEAEELVEDGPRPG